MNPYSKAQKLQMLMQQQDAMFGGPGMPSTQGVQNFLQFNDDHPEYNKAMQPPDVQQWQHDRRENDLIRSRGKFFLMPPKKNPDPDTVAANPWAMVNG